MRLPQFAPVGPLDSLRQLYENDLMGNYQLVIAPVVLEHAAEYRAFFIAHDDQFIILDNGVIELGYPMPANDLARAAWTVGAHVVVLPDSVDDGPYTVKLSRKAFAEFRRLDAKTDLLGVVQGKTMEECLQCARDLVDIGVDWLAAPRGLTLNLGSRLTLVQEGLTKYGKPIHILGFSDNIEDDIETAACHPLVRGIDAATPLWSMTALPFEPPTDSRYLGNRPIGFWQGLQNPLAAPNVMRVRQWIARAVARPVPTSEVVRSDATARRMQP